VEPTPAPVRRGKRTVEGIASTYGEGYDGYLALPEGRGHRVRVCYEGRCVERVSNDAGPALHMQRQGRVIDLDVPTFEQLACPAGERHLARCQWQTLGLLRGVTVTYL
jgi:hypothetical protein